jgi:signal transduction histidine kinase
MGFWKFRPTKTLVLVVVLSVLLVTLATLQYRWLGQVSTGERERMQASLDAGTTRFSQDFNREITRAYLSFQMDSTDLQNEKSEAVASRLDQWQANAPYPGLISELFLVDTADDGVARITHFNRALRKYDRVEWPVEFTGLRQSLEKENQNISRGPELVREITIRPVEPNIPALIVPIIGAPRGLLSDKQNIRVERKEHVTKFVEGLPFAGYLIIKLDINVIKNELIPNLAKRYFSGTGGLEYDLTVVNLKKEGTPLYQSNIAKTNPEAASGDASARLMDIQPEQLDALWFGLPRRAVASEQIDSTVERKLPSDKVIVRTDSQNQNATTNQRSVTVRVFNREMKEFGATDKNVERGPWQLLIQHRSGSLDAAVASTRRRNLAISFGILVLLGASVAMIVASTRRAERLANQQMDFVSAVSHEFRTPLSVICSAGENLADGVIVSSQQTRTYGELIRNEGRRLTEMVEQVLEYAGARSLNRTFQFRPVDIESAIDDALSSFEQAIEAKGYVVEREIDDDLPLVAADSGAIRSSLQNLLSNALKYESENRWIGIRAKFSSTSNGDEIAVTVEDHGIGIATDEVGHVFEPFFRGRDVVDRQIHGNGLGLSLVKQAIEAHHGRVSLVSVLGKGSAFTLHLPVVNKTASRNTEIGQN